MGTMASLANSIDFKGGEESKNPSTTTTTSELDLEKEYAKNRTAFGRILRGEDFYTNSFIYEDEHCVAFHDIQPLGEFSLEILLIFTNFINLAPVHVLVIPRKHIPGMSHVKDNDEQVCFCFSNLERLKFFVYSF